MKKNQKKRALIGIFSVIFFDIVAFGMVIPLTPILAREFGAGGFGVGLIISAYSMVQFLFAPFWGRLSDIFGRKPIILIGLLGSSLAHLFFAFSDTFADIFLSRLLAGFFGGNVVIATAYIADVTSEENRSKNMGLIGMAFGGGFTVGPLIGFLFILLGGRLGELPPFGANFASLGSSLLCWINCLMSFFFLKESLIERKKTGMGQTFSLTSVFSKFKQQSSLFTRPSPYMIWESLKVPKLGFVLILSFILWFSLAQIEPVLILLVQDDFSWGKRLAYGSFIYIGLLMVLSQAWLVRWWIPKWGERFVNHRGLFAMFIGLIAIAISGILVSPASDFFSIAFVFLLLGVTFFSIGYSLSNTCLNGSLSLLTSQKKQGSIFGVNQSLSAIARIAGPVTGGWFYQKLSHESPFFIAGILAFTAFILSVWFKKLIPDKGLKKAVLAVTKKEGEDLSMYALNKYQLKNLTDKNIHFSFFQLEDFSSPCGKDIMFLLNKAERIEAKELLLNLKDQDLKQPVVLICNKGSLSVKTAQELRVKGFLNVYFVEGGLQGLSSDDIFKS